MCLAVDLSTPYGIRLLCLIYRVLCAPARVVVICYSSYLSCMWPFGLRFVFFFLVGQRCTLLGQSQLLGFHTLFLLCLSKTRIQKYLSVTDTSCWCSVLQKRTPRSLGRRRSLRSSLPAPLNVFRIECCDAVDFFYSYDYTRVLFEEMETLADYLDQRFSSETNL